MEVRKYADNLKTRIQRLKMDVQLTNNGYTWDALARSLTLAPLLPCSDRIVNSSPFKVRGLSPYFVKVLPF